MRKALQVVEKRALQMGRCRRRQCSENVDSVEEGISVGQCNKDCVDGALRTKALSLKAV